jgi:hypothetical protein
MISTRATAATLLALALTLSCGSERTDSPATGGVAPTTGGAFGSGGLSGAGGATGGTGAILGGGGAPPAPCRGTGESCVNSLDCCEGSTCNNTAQAPALNGCHPRCSKDAECATGCCVLFTGDTNGICAEKQWCGCGMTGSACGSTLPACCGDHVCLAKDAQRTSFACSKKCQTNADCSTSCCVPIPSLNQSACLDPSFCPAP